MDAFFGMADLAVMILVMVITLVFALDGVRWVLVWFEHHPRATENVKLLIGACVGIPMMLLIVFGVGHLTYVALVATYSWFVA